MPRIYLYKLTTDEGGAPCVRDGLLTLAICKPMIRTSAQIGDLIFGFAANRMHSGRQTTSNHLIYIARVEERLSGHDYYGDSRFADRMDWIYEPTEEGFAWRAGARCHGPEHLAHDLGQPPAYHRAVVLASRDFRYYGRHGSNDYKTRFPAVKQVVEHMRQGHRVNHNEALRLELEELQKSAWQSTAGLPGSQPAETVSARRCRRRVGRSAGCSSR